MYLQKFKEINGYHSQTLQNLILEEFSNKTIHFLIK